MSALTICDLCGRDVTHSNVRGLVDVSGLNMKLDLCAVCLWKSFYGTSSIKGSELVRAIETMPQ